jgi:hypothetical protein
MRGASRAFRKFYKNFFQRIGAFGLSFIPVGEWMIIWSSWTVARNATWDVWIFSGAGPDFALFEPLGTLTKERFAPVGFDLLFKFSLRKLL